MKFDYSYLGAQLLITAVCHSITQHPQQMSAAAGKTALECNTPPSSRGPSEMAADHGHHGNGLARDDQVLCYS